jgi:hypothetical protein
MIQSGRQSHHLWGSGIFTDVVPDAVKEQSFAARFSARAQAAVWSAVIDEHGHELSGVVVEFLPDGYCTGDLTMLSRSRLIMKLDFFQLCDSLHPAVSVERLV